MTPPPCVLVVDDEPAIRTVVALALRAAGFDVIDAASAEEALLTFRAAHRRVDVLVTDVVMPGMSGSELAVRVVATAPRTRVVYLTAPVPAMVGAPPVPRSHCVHKPFAVQDLVAVVRALLAEAEAPEEPRRIG